MKITDYEKKKTLVNSNVFLMDGDDGTKGILAHDLAVSLSALLSSKEQVANLTMADLLQISEVKESDRLLVGTSEGTKAISMSDGVYAMLDAVIDASTRRSLWRGKKLGTAVTDDQYDEIDNSTFRGIFLGDYWEIGGKIWRVVDFDYWYGCGDTSCTTHHLVIMPDSQLYTGKMNEDNDTTGAYVNSEMYKTGLENAKTIVNGAFTAAHVLNHREYLQNATTSGYASAGAWFNSTVELPNEPMMCGSYIVTPAGNGTIEVNRHTISKSQLAGMRVNPTLISPARQNQWLRDVVSETRFALMGYDGVANPNSASHSRGVRPVFGICKKNTE